MVGLGNPVLFSTWGFKFSFRQRQLWYQPVPVSPSIPGYLPRAERIRPMTRIRLAVSPSR
jgi:hypothetical protein